MATSLSQHNAAQRGASTRIARILALDTPPDPAASEINEKGAVNARAVIGHRPDAVARLREGRHPDVLHVAKTKEAAL